MEPIFLYFAAILLIAFAISSLLKFFNQPIIIGYILAGVLISPFVFNIGATKEIVDVFFKFGIAFLLFIVGLHLNPKVIKEMGTLSLFIGLIEIILTFGFGFGISRVLGFDLMASSYIGMALSMSSAIIITKLLSDKKQIDSLYGKITIGILIVQNLVAIAVLIFISLFSNGINFGSVAIRTLSLGIGLAGLLLFLGIFVLPKMLKGIAKSQELLFLFSITWAFIITAAFSYLNISIEVGALVAGITLSALPYSIEINSKIKPLGDLFLIAFLIILGLGVEISNIGSIILNAVIFSLVVLFFKPLVVMVSMGFFGYTKRNNFLVGTTLSQISEFSLKILVTGVLLGHIGEEIVSTITLSAMITIVISTYLISFSNDHYQIISKFVPIFERKDIKRGRKVKKDYDAILFGYNRIGFSILRSFKKIRKNYLVVDFNPDVIATLDKFRIPNVYGDAFDSEFLDELPLEKVKIIVSTIPDFETNLLLLETVRLVNPNAIVILRAHQIEDAFEFYKKGASYVLTPHFLGGEYVAKMVENLDTKEDDYKKEKIKHIEMLTEMSERNKKHPDVERG